MSGTNTPIRPGTDEPTLEVKNDPDRDTLLVHRQSQPEHFQGGGFTGQNSGSNEYEFISGSNTNPAGNYLNGGAATMPNMPTANLQEQNALQLPGSNDMPNQRSFLPNAHLYPQFAQSAFGSAPTLQTTRFNLNQVPQNLNPGLAEATTRPPSIRQLSQPTRQPTPQPQAMVPSPRSPVPFWSVYFQNFDQVNTYLNEVAWFPSMGRYGLPQSTEQYKFYIQKLSGALLNIQNVWDIETAPWQLGKFLPNGDWTNARDAEAIAHTVLLAGMRIHISGVTDFAHSRTIEHMSFNSEDIDVTFPQRMHFVAMLLEHSKAAAAEVMTKVNIDKYVAAPITALRNFATFEDTWTNSSPLEKQNMLEVQPYVGSGVTHPPPELQTQLTSMASTRYQHVYAERQGRYSGMGKAAHPRDQAFAEQDGGMPQRWSPAVNTGQGGPSTPGTNASQNWAQANAHAAMPGSNEHFTYSLPYSGQNTGEGANSPDFSGV